MRIHPAACILPEMGEREFAELVEDIRRNGLLCPIECVGDQILDGRHRYKACQHLGIEPEYNEVDLESMTPGEYVWSLNGNRRHLSASQRAACYVELIGEKEKEKAKERQKLGGGAVPAKLPEAVKGNARDAIAAQAGVSPRTVEDAKTVKAADPKLFERVKAGDVTVSQAAKDVREQKQRSETPWTESEEKRKAAVLKGRSVVANKSTDGHLVAWAAEQGLLLPVDRNTAWGNPFILEADGDRDTVCDNYEVYFELKPSLLGKVSSLKGKVLLCWCHPERCHADYLAGIANRGAK